MAFKSLINHRLGIVEIRHFGEVDVSDVIYGRSTAIDLCEKYSLGRVLLNVREAVDIVSIVHAYTFVRSYKVSEATLGFKVAIMVKDIPNDLKLIEIISNSKVLNLSVFENSEAALQWLLE